MCARCLEGICGVSTGAVLPLRCGRVMPALTQSGTVWEMVLLKIDFPVRVCFRLAIPALIGYNVN